MSLMFHRVFLSHLEKTFFKSQRCGWWYLILTRRILIGAGFKIALAIISFIFWSIIYCMFYFIARFEVTTKELIKASVVMAFLNAPRMVLIFICVFLPYLICAWYIQWGLAIWLFATTVTLYYISKEFNGQLEMLYKDNEQ